MRLSKDYIKTIKEATREYDSISHQLLVQGGFIDQVASGIFTYLTPGLTVLTKIEQIVREEMNKLGALEMLLPSLHPRALWDQTKRWDAVDFHFKLQSGHNREYALGASHEEVATPLAQKFIQNYKDLPLAFYQIATKYRDEARPKSGILRGREFRMKDMYSFHTNKQDLEKFYHKALKAYLQVYKRLGLDDVRVTTASGGIFTQNPSHEFSVPTPAGEDTLLYCENCDFTQNTEVVKKELKECPQCSGKLLTTKAIEVGNIFKYDYRYSKNFNLKFLDESEEPHLVYTGAYGIGTSRLMGAIAEVHHDEKGIVWPTSVTPFHLHLANLSKNQTTFAEAVYRTLTAEGISVLYDDREGVSPGEKLVIADLIGVPIRLVVSDRTKGNIEWKLRPDTKTRMLTTPEVVARVKDAYQL